MEVGSSRSSAESYLYLQRRAGSPTPTPDRLVRPYCCSSLERSEAQVCLWALFAFSKLPFASQIGRGCARMDRSHSPRSTYRRGRRHISWQFTQWQCSIPGFSNASTECRRYSIVGGRASGCKLAGTDWRTKTRFNNKRWDTNTRHQTSFSTQL